MKTESSQLRAATEADVPAIQALLRVGHLPVDGVDGPLVAGMCVAVFDDIVVGCAAIERCGPVGLLRSVVVDPRLRGTGMGDRLVRDRLAWAATAGLESVYLLTTTAAPFFERHGFRVVARPDLPGEIRATSEFTTLCPDTAVAMARPTGGPACTFDRKDPGPERGDRP